MKRVLSFGGGVQTTALAILVSQGKVKCDTAIFADTGGERPETYWYMENYTQPLLESAGIPFLKIKQTLPSCQPDLYGWLWKHSQIPSVTGSRLCSVKFKKEAIKRHVGEQYVALIGFSIDEANRANRVKPSKDLAEYPLIALGLSVADCHHIIGEYGWPTPIKSSCYFCPFQTPYEWQWMKLNHPDLFQKTLELEARYHERNPNSETHLEFIGGCPYAISQRGNNTRWD